MSKKFLSPIKLAQGASNPAVGSAGELFFNTTDVKVYAHNGTSWVPSGGGVTVSATAPSTPIAGDAWYDTVDGTLYVYYNDGDSSQWVEVAANSGISVALEGRLGVVETYVTTLQSEMDTAQADIDAVESRATSLESRATTLETNVREVSLGGTGASSHTSGAYLKGAGTSAITSQVGIPAGDITSGTLNALRLPAGTVVGFNRIRTTARSAYGYNSDTILSDLNISITPKYSNSLLVVQWQVMYESDYNSVFRIYRDNGLVYTSGYQGYNENDGNGWSGVASLQYDTDVASTPSNQLVQYFVPAGSTSTTTLQLAVRSSYNTASTFYLNRSTNSGGSNAYEIGVSTALIWEIAQ